MTMSYFTPSRSRHWPPTSGVLAMFLCANSDSFLSGHNALYAIAPGNEPLILENIT
jgi:hypothetical protein